MFGLVFHKDILCCFHPFSSFVMFGFDNMEKPSVFDPRGQAMLTLTGKI